MSKKGRDPEAIIVRWLVVLAILLIAIMYFGLTKGYAMSAFVAMIIVSFAGFFRIGYALESSWGLHESAIRTAITGSTVIVYLVLVALASFPKGPFGAGERLPAMAQTMLDSFTSVTILVITFYFGSSALVAAIGKLQRDPDGEGRTPPEPPTPNAPEHLGTPEPTTVARHDTPADRGRLRGWWRR
jgi:hypothetical protein